MKKSSSVLALALSMSVLSYGVSAYAAENEAVEVEPIVAIEDATEIELVEPIVGIENSNVSIESPSNKIIETYGLSAPASSSFVDLTVQKLTFAGAAAASDLYTNKLFKGKSTVKYTINNTGGSTLKVKVYEDAALFISKQTITISAKKTGTGSITGLDKTKKYYLKFDAPSSFDGYLE